MSIKPTRLQDHCIVQFLGGQYKLRKQEIASGARTTLMGRNIVKPRRLSSPKTGDESERSGSKASPCRIGEV